MSDYSAKKTISVTTPRVDPNQKDILLSQLKTQIFEMGENDRHFTNMKCRLDYLQNEYNLLKEETRRLDADYNIKSDSAVKQLTEIKSDIDTIKQTLGNKVETNKKLCQDYLNLENIVEKKSEKIKSLREEFNECVNINSRLIDEKNEKEKYVKNQKESKQRIRSEFNSLMEDNHRLSFDCRDEEMLIKDLEEVRVKYLELNETIKFETANMQTKIIQQDENLSYHQKELEESNRSISDLNVHIKKLEMQAERIHSELEYQNRSNQKQMEVRIIKEKEYEQTERFLVEKEANIKNSLDILNDFTEQKEKLYEDKSKMYNEIDRLKNHVYILAGQNQRLAAELNKIAEQDHRIKRQLKRKEKINQTIQNNISKYEQNLGPLECDHINRNKNEFDYKIVGIV